MKVELKNKAMIVIDYTQQNVFGNERTEWDLTLSKVQALRGKLVQAIALAQAKNWAIVQIATVEWSKANLPDNINRLYETNPEAAFYSQGQDHLVLEADAKVFVKNSYSAFGGTQGKLHRWLKQRKINDLVICGIYSTGCVNATIVEAFALGYHLTILKDCVQTFDRADKQRYQKMLFQEWSYMYGNVTTLKEIQ